MADFETLIKKFVGEDGAIQADKVSEMIKDVTGYVGSNFVDRSRYKEKNDALKDLQNKLDDSGDLSDKYKKLESDFKAYKQEQETKAIVAKKQDAYRDLLKQVGVSEKRFGAIMKVTDPASIELDDSGKLKDIDKIKKDIETEWGEFIVKSEPRGADTSKPPAKDGGSPLTREDIFKEKDGDKRRKMISQNPQLFGIE